MSSPIRKRRRKKGRRVGDGKGAGKEGEAQEKKQMRRPKWCRRRRRKEYEEEVDGTSELRKVRKGKEVEVYRGQSDGMWGKSFLTSRGCISVP